MRWAIAEVQKRFKKDVSVNKHFYSQIKAVVKKDDPLKRHFIARKNTNAHTHARTHTSLRKTQRYYWLAHSNRRSPWLLKKYILKTENEKRFGKTDSSQIEDKK